MAELHIIGEIAQGADFGGGSFFCIFELIAGSGWTPIEGTTSGCTHIMQSADDAIPWCFPVDTHFSFTSVQGWPKISVQVWQVDAYGRKDIAGYGVAYLPMPSAGEQTVEIVTWKPQYWSPGFFARLYEKMRLMFMGGNPVLRDTALIHRNDERFKLHTIGSGSVTLSLTLLSRGMKKSGMIFK
eukprot:gene3740-2636_t